MKTNLRAAALACADCHTVPTSTTHATGTVDLTWGALARTGGLTPTPANLDRRRPRPPGRPRPPAPTTATAPASPAAVAGHRHHPELDRRRRRHRLRLLPPGPAGHRRPRLGDRHHQLRHLPHRLQPAPPPTWPPAPSTRPPTSTAPWTRRPSAAPPATARPPTPRPPVATAGATDRRQGRRPPGPPREGQPPRRRPRLRRLPHRADLHHPRERHGRPDLERPRQDRRPHPDPGQPRPAPAQTTWEATPTCTNYCHGAGFAAAVQGHRRHPELDRRRRRHRLRLLPQGPAGHRRPRLGDRHHQLRHLPHRLHLHHRQPGRLHRQQGHPPQRRGRTRRRSTCTSCHGSATNAAPAGRHRRRTRPASRSAPTRPTS